MVALGTTFAVNPSLYRKPPFDPLADFTYLSILGRSPTTLVAHTSVPVSSVAEFIAYAKKEPISYAHGGPGTPGLAAIPVASAINAGRRGAGASRLNGFNRTRIQSVPALPVRNS